MRTDRFDLPLRIVVDNPPPGFGMVLQSGATARGDLLPPSHRSDAALTFDFTATVDGVLPDGRPRLLGPCVQGPPAARFVYLCIHPLAGAAFCGRAKVPLKDLGWLVIDALKPGERLCAHYDGTGRGGAPAFATVRLTRGWARVPT